jgi:isopentenyl-diphosphate delta-isomerase
VRLQQAGVRAIDVAGRGGTSWYKVEAKRSAKGGQPAQATFADWGIPTEEALVQVRSVLPEFPVIASGGIRSGLDIAKAVALGANIAAIGQPLLEPALKSPEKVIEFLSGIIREIKIAMLCVGATDLAQLHEVPLARRS